MDKSVQSLAGQDHDCNGNYIHTYRDYGSGPPLNTHTLNLQGLCPTFAAREPGDKAT